MILLIDHPDRDQCSQDGPLRISFDDPQLQAARVIGYQPGLGSCIAREE